MSMNQTPMSERVHIGFFGKRIPDVCFTEGAESATIIKKTESVCREDHFRCTPIFFYGGRKVTGVLPGLQNLSGAYQTSRVGSIPTCPRQIKMLGR